jgi:hypothetical protein
MILLGFEDTKDTFIWRHGLLRCSRPQRSSWIDIAIGVAGRHGGGFPDAIVLRPILFLSFGGPSEGTDNHKSAIRSEYRL